MTKLTTTAKILMLVSALSLSACATEPNTMNAEGETAATSDDGFGMGVLIFSVSVLPVLIWFAWALSEEA